MIKVLHIVASPRGENSTTRSLGNTIISRIKETHNNVVVKERILSENSYPHLEEIQITSFFTPEENRTSEQIAAIKNSDESVAELKEADIIVIGSPMYNFSIPSSLKAYFDHIARAKVTFRYDENGSEGLLKNKKAYVAMASAGVFDNDEMRRFDFATPYVKHFLGFLGITDVKVFRVEGTGIPDLQATAMAKAIKSISLHDF